MIDLKIKQVKVLLDDERELLFSEGEAHTTTKGQQIFYEDDLIKLVLSVEQATVTSLRLQAELKKEELFQSAAGFTANDTIQILLDLPEEFTAFMANYRHKNWWTRPAFGTRVTEVPEKTQSLILKNGKNQQYLLPVFDGPFKSDLAGDEQGLWVKISPLKAGMNQLEGMLLVAAEGENPYELVEQAVAYGVENTNCAARPRTEKTYPVSLDYLGWCTWDAFYQKVNAQGIEDKMMEFKELDIPIKWVMIDDGWSDIIDRKLNRFEADATKFPNGLGATVKKIKEAHEVKWVGVWHTIGGYWNGIHPESQIAADYQAHLYPNGKGILTPHPQASKAVGFWHAWHKYLKGQGIDFVKIDSQSAVANFFLHEFNIFTAATGTHESLEASTALHFDNTIINCMGMASENVWSRPESSVSRNSDDFVPQETNSFSEHALQNVYNSFYHGAFYWGDWDMYWSQNHDDKQNMVLRAVSGGPIYISDGLGKTNKENIMPLVYKNGKILRADAPAQPTSDSLFSDPLKENKLLKTWNTVKDNVYIAAFNLSGTQEIADTICLEEQLLTGEFICYDSLDKRIVNVEQAREFACRLAPQEVKLYQFIPKQAALVAIGLTNKFLANHGILSQELTEEKAVFTLYEGGHFEFYTTKYPTNAVIDGESYEIQEVAPNHYQIVCDAVSGTCRLELSFKS